MRSLALALLLLVPSAFADSISIVSPGTPPLREGAVAISPVQPQIVLAAAIGGMPAPLAEVHTFRSTDSGQTWTALGMLPKQLGSTPLVGHWDPVLAYDRTGRAFLAVVAAENAGRWRIAVYRSDDHGTTWTGVDAASPSVSRNDKPWIAIDDALGVHLAWYPLRVGETTLAYAASRDRGLTFSEPRSFPSSGWPFVATSLDGDVYITHTAGPATWDILRSADRGVTFGPQVRIATLPGTLPHMVAADRSNVYAFMPGNDGVYFSRSTDRGTTWSQPVRYAGANGAWLPSVAVDPLTGEVILAWQERGSESQARVMSASSMDGGATFGPPRAVSPFFPAGRPYGEYNQLAAYGGLHIIVWADATGVFKAATLDARATAPVSRPRRRAVSH